MDSHCKVLNTASFTFILIISFLQGTRIVSKHIKSIALSLKSLCMSMLLPKIIVLITGLCDSIVLLLCLKKVYLVYLNQLLMASFLLDLALWSSLQPASSTTLLSWLFVRTRWDFCSGTMCIDWDLWVGFPIGWKGTILPHSYILSPIVELQRYPPLY